jgi:hypothetical protein
MVKEIATEYFNRYTPMQFHTLGEGRLCLQQLDKHLHDSQESRGKQHHRQ